MRGEGRGGVRGGRQKKVWVVGAGDENYKTLECEGQHMTKHNTSDAPRCKTQ